MSVIADVSVAAEEFSFGEALSSGLPVSSELERVIPSEEVAIPYVWVECDDLLTFEYYLRRNEQVKSVERLDRVDEQSLYRIEWDETQGLLQGILEAEGAIMEAYGGEMWRFQLRFDDHERLAEFYNFCMETGITITVDRVYTLTQEYRRGRLFDLTPDQREALVLAARLGYFETPSKVTLDKIGEELGISSQAASKRIRGGVEKLVTGSLLTTT